MMGGLANALVRLEQTLSGLGAAVIPIMRPGLDSARVRGRLRGVGLDVEPDSDILDWFGWHDGAGDSETSAKSTQLVPGGEFLDLEYLIGEYQQACDVARYVIETGPPTSLTPEDLWRPSWFPVLMLSGKGLLAVELDTVHTGAVRIVWWESEPKERARIAWPNLGEFVEDVISRFESGEYWVDEAGNVQGEWIGPPDARP
jgi:cell wall assembly regulator SMI1